MQTRLPQVDKLLREAELSETLSQFKREIVVRVVRSVLEQLRSEGSFPDNAAIVELVKQGLHELKSPSLKKVINGTGVVLNTNLGRAPLAQAHIEQLKNVAAGYCNLELNLQTGKRGKRASRLERLINILSGAESSLAVNNNAAALVLAVNCFSLGKEVIVSRGELIEIGGSFRLPDVIEAAGGKLHEVGTTNKTRLSDFERAIGPQTGLVMRCHRSNFEVRGFTEEARLGDLAKLCRAREVPLLEDLGSGVLMNLAELGLDEEPTLSQSIESGCDLVAFSGDKLLGGPQAGIIAGKKSLCEKLSRHPLYRALRLDKITISLLEQTLSAYLLKNTEEILPALFLIAASEEELRKRVCRFIDRTQESLNQIILEPIATSSATGGGSLPGKEKKSSGVLLRTPWKATTVAQKLRQFDPPVITITRDDDNIIDFRTVFPAEEALLVIVLQKLENELC